MHFTSLGNSRARCDIHKQHIFTGKELKFLFQPAFSRNYIGRVALECSFRSSPRSSHSVHWPFPFGFRGIPFAPEPFIFFPFSLSLVYLFLLSFLSRFAICDFWHVSYSWVRRAKSDPWATSTQNIKFNLTNSINSTNEVGTQNVSLTFVTHICVFVLFPLFFRSFSVLF